MNYRKAKLSDLDKLSKLFDCYRIFYRKETDIKGAKDFLEERISNNDSEIFVAVADDYELAGFVQLYPIFSSTRMKRVWLLNDLYVDKEHRGKGISVELISKSKKLVAQTKAYGLLLETEKSNVIGNSLYPRTGFRLNDDSNFYEWTVE